MNSITILLSHYNINESLPLYFTASAFAQNMPITQVKQTQQKVVALTFDDGPNEDTLQQIIDILNKEKVLATFFMLGNNINKNTSLVIGYCRNNTKLATTQ